jgi:hypothetical protein
MAENVIASLQIGTTHTVSVEEYRARKVALITGKCYLYVYKLDKTLNSNFIIIYNKKVLPVKMVLIWSSFC